MVTRIKQRRQRVGNMRSKTRHDVTKAQTKKKTSQVNVGALREDEDAEEQQAET